MVNYYVYATDDSESTNGEYYFNSKGLETLKSFKNDVKILQNDSVHDRTVYLHWSDKCVRVDVDEVVSRYVERNRHGLNTLPHTVLDWFKRNLNKDDTIKLLYIVTDGAINPDSIRRCEPGMKIENVVFAALNPDLREIDMSVASMFINNNKSYTVYCNEELIDEADLSKPFEYDRINIKTFYGKRDELKSYIKLQFLTKSSSDDLALDEINKLKRLRVRLLYELKTADGNPEGTIDLNVKEKEVFIRNFKQTSFYKALMNPKQNDHRQNIESYINTLINYIKIPKKSFQFHNLKFVKNNKTVTEQYDNVFNIDYECIKQLAFPTIVVPNEPEVPVILLSYYSLFDTIIFTREETQMADFYKFRNTIECPLFLLHDKHFGNSIKRLDNLEAFKNTIKIGMPYGPLHDISGAIVPLEEFDDNNDYVLDCTYFDGKRVPYNKELLYYVILKTCENLEHMDPSVVDYFKRYIMRRISNGRCYLGLSAVAANDPLIRVNLTTALWYCLELSTVLFKNDHKHFTKEKMRMYCSLTEYMKEILTWFDYRIDDSLINKRKDIFKHLNQLQRKTRYSKRVRFILEEIFTKKDGFLVAEIKNPDNIYKLNYLRMNLRNPVDENILTHEVDLEKFVYFLDHVDIIDVPICERTLRPYFITKSNKSFYEELMMATSKVLIIDGEMTLEPVYELNFSRILPLYKLYIKYVEEKLKFPTKDEFKAFVLKIKQYYFRKFVVFPLNDLVSMEKVCDRYETIIKNEDNPISVSQFLEITDLSAKRMNRIILEDPTRFNMKELSGFIAVSESNVRLVDKIERDLRVNFPRPTIAWH